MHKRLSIPDGFGPVPPEPLPPGASIELLVSHVASDPRWTGHVLAAAYLLRAVETWMNAELAQPYHAWSRVDGRTVALAHRTWCNALRDVFNARLSAAPSTSVEFAELERLLIDGWLAATAGFVSSLVEQGAVAFVPPWQAAGRSA